MQEKMPGVKKNKYSYLYFTVMIAVVIASILVWKVAVSRYTVEINEMQQNMFSTYVVLIVLCACVCTTLFFLIAHEYPKIDNRLFILTMVLLAISSCIAMTPLSVPDGEFHFASVMNLSDRMLSALPGFSGLSGRIPADLLHIEAFGDAAYSWKFWNEWQPSHLISDEGIYSEAGGSIIIAYIVPAIGITISRILNLPYQLIVLSGRWCNFAFFLVCVSCACRMTPELTKAFRAICLLPATVWIACSYSYDVWNLAFCFLIVSYCVKLSRLDQVTVKELIPFAVFTILLIPVKLIYFVLAGCIFMVQPLKIPHKKRMLAVALIFVALLAAIFMLTRGAEVASDLQGNFDARSGLTEETSFSLGYIVRNPWRTFLVYVKTIFLSGGTYLIKSVTGENYGAYLPSILSFAILAIFIVIESGSLDSIKIGTRKTLISWLIFLLGSLLVLTSFLMIYTEIPENEITAIGGVQGRYFLPLYVLLPFMLAPVHRQLTQNHPPLRENTVDKLLIALAILSMLTSICRFAGLVMAPELR
jgi:uncharacterized membrane protein